MIREKVAALESPHVEDDKPVKFAIVGYSYHRSAESWGREEFDFVGHRRREVADFDTPWVDFTCLASGYLVGLHQAGRCSEPAIADLPRSAIADPTGNRDEQAGTALTSRCGGSGHAGVR